MQPVVEPEVMHGPLPATPEVIGIKALEQGFEIRLPDLAEVSSYQIRYRPDTHRAFITHHMSESSVRVFGLAALETYVVQARARNVFGWGPWSEPVTVKPT